MYNSMILSHLFLLFVYVVFQLRNALKLSTKVVLEKKNPGDIIQKIWASHFLNSPENTKKSLLFPA